MEKCKVEEAAEYEEAKIFPSELVEKRQLLIRAQAIFELLGRVLVCGSWPSIKLR